MALLSVDRVVRTYRAGHASVTAVDHVSLALEAGDFVAVVGPSGCGKSTLLHLCGAMDRPTAGAVLLEGTRLDTLSDEKLTRIRRERVGFVFQFFDLLPTLTVFENVQLPLLLAGQPSTRAADQAAALLARVGLEARRDHYPAQVSGGELQRAALARALVHRPALVVADEPTGNLDTENGRRVLELLSELNRELGVTLLLATHATDTAAAARRIVRMRDGRLEPDSAGANRAPV